MQKSSGIITLDFILVIVMKKFNIALFCFYATITISPWVVAYFYHAFIPLAICSNIIYALCAYEDPE